MHLTRVLPPASCSHTPNWKILSCSAAIKAEVRGRVYWTNVSIDPKVSVDIFFHGLPARFLASKFTRLGVVSPTRNRELQSRGSTIKLPRRRGDHLMRRY